MQEINLLQNKLKDTTNQWEKSNRVVGVLLSLVIIAELVAGGMFYMLTKSAEDAKIAMDQENLNIQRELDQMEDQLKAAKGLQAQAKNIKSLLRTHVIWTDLVDGVATHTYKTGRLFSMNSETDGIINIEGLTPDYIQLGKMILGLQSYDQVESVKLLQSGPSTGELSGVLFSLQVNVKPDVFLTKN